MPRSDHGGGGCVGGRQTITKTERTDLNLLQREFKLCLDLVNIKVLRWYGLVYYYYNNDQLLST